MLCIFTPPPNPNTCHTTPPTPLRAIPPSPLIPPPYHYHPSYPPPLPVIPPSPLIPSLSPAPCHTTTTPHTLPPTPLNLSPPPPPPPPSSWVTPPTPCREIKITKKKKKKVECWHESVTGCIQGIAWIDGAENTKLNKKHFSINDVMSKCFVICYDAHLPLLKACVCPTPDQERPACTCNLKGTQTCLPVWLGSILYA